MNYRITIYFLLIVGLSSLTNTAIAQKKNKKASSCNTLTKAEKKEGWLLLFDGKTFNGWRNFKKDSVSKAWQVINGEIVLNDKNGGDIITIEQYDNFELKLEWKIAKGGNSGIFYHVVEDPKYNRTFETGPEMQILDNQRHPDGKNGTDRQAGALYDMYSPAKDVTKEPEVEFNQVRILVKDNHVEHWLNGVKVVEYTKGSDDWNTRLKESKFATWEGFAKYNKGHIALQDHGDKVWFRNIKIKKL